MTYRIKRGGWAWALAALMLGGSGAAVYGQSSEIVTVNALQWIDNSIGWCRTLNAGGVAINIRDTGLPPGFTDPGNVRYIEIMHADVVNPSTPFCARLGGDNTAPNLRCDPAAPQRTRTTGYVGAEGRFRTMEVRSPNTPQTAPLWVAAGPASDVTVCITLFW